MVEQYVNIPFDWVWFRNKFQKEETAFLLSFLLLPHALAVNSDPFCRMVL